MPVFPHPARIEDLQRVRKLNGVVPLFSHVSQLVNFGNELHQEYNRADIIIPMDTYITNLAEVVIPVQVHEDVAKVEVAILARATAQGVHAVSFTSNGDATGIRLRIANFFNRAPDTLAHAVWRSGGPQDGDTTRQEARALRLTADAQNFDEITYVGNANVRIYAFRIRHIPPRSL